MLHKQSNPIIKLALLLALAGIPKTATASLLAQSNSDQTSFSAPDTLPKDTKIIIAGSNSTTGITQSLKNSFEKQYPNAKINFESQETPQTLKTLSNGQADLITIGRSLTPEEKTAGFVSVPFSREKIAIVVSKNNSFDGSLSIDQFAKIFRGEITDWSELGGAPGKIELVDLPDTNDTRQAFPSYTVFQKDEFKTAADAVKLQQDNIDDVISNLGENGISYAVAEDVINRDDVKVVKMHQTEPSDLLYPFFSTSNFCL